MFSPFSKEDDYLIQVKLKTKHSMPRHKRLYWGFYAIAIIAAITLTVTL
jgi:hypothetical protein